MRSLRQRRRPDGGGTSNVFYGRESRVSTPGSRHPGMRHSNLYLNLKSEAQGGGAALPDPFPSSPYRLRGGLARPKSYHILIINYPTLPMTL